MDELALSESGGGGAAADVSASLARAADSLTALRRTLADLHGAAPPSIGLPPAAVAPEQRG